jgi:hypothetical protein
MTYITSLFDRVYNISLRQSMITVLIVVSTISTLGYTDTAEASTLVVSPATIIVHQGESFSVKVGVNPGGISQYTVKMSMLFLPTRLKLSTWQPQDQWTVLRQPGYDLFNNEAGILVRTGGYPEGFATPVTFGVATFVATKEGTAHIEISPDTFIYDGASANTYTGANSVTVTILPPFHATTPVVIPVIHSFDIAAELSQSVISLSSTSAGAPNQAITAMIHLTNTAPVVKNNNSSSSTTLDVPLQYLLINSRGEIIRNEIATTTLSGVNSVFAHTVATTGLVPDTYTLVSRVTYPDLIAPAESKVTFVIRDDSTPPPVAPHDQYGLTDVLYALSIFVLGIILSVYAIKGHRQGKKHSRVKKTS